MGIVCIECVCESNIRVFEHKVSLTVGNKIDAVDEIAQTSVWIVIGFPIVI